MVVAFAGAETGKPLHLFGPSAFHLIAALVVRRFACFQVHSLYALTLDWVAW